MEMRKSDAIVVALIIIGLCLALSFAMAWVDATSISTLDPLP